MRQIALSIKMAALIPAVAAMGTVLAACGGGDTSQPASTTTSTTAGMMSDMPGMTSSSMAGMGGNDMWFMSVKSCDLLSTSDAAAAGFKSAGTPIANTMTTNSCGWSQSQLADLRIVLESSTYDSIAAEPNGPLQDVTIAGRPGKLTEDPTGTCDVSVKASSGSRAVVTVKGAASGDKECSIAKQIAQDIAPKLPSL